VLLLLPTATYRAGDFLAAAGRLGVEVLVGSERQQALAGTMGDRFLLLPLDEPERAAAAIVAHSRLSPIDAVVAVDDQGVVAAAIASRDLGLPHSPPDAVRATRDKAEMRSRLAGAGVAQARFAVVGAGGGDEAVAAAAAAIGFPVVIKPTSLSGSRGVIRADDSPAVLAAAARIRAIIAEAGAPAGASLLVEEFLPGDEVAVEGILRRGVLEVLAVFDKPDPLDGPFFEETIYVTPSRRSASVLANVADVTSAAALALGLTEGPVHAEVRIDRLSGTARLIEMAARTIGGRCSKVLTFATGQSLEELVLAHALGLDATQAFLPPAAAGAAGVMMLPIARTGILREVGGVDSALAVAGVTGVEISATVGRRVRAIPEGDRYLGFMFARGETPQEVEAALRAGLSALRIRIDAGTAADGPERPPAC
jgi:biotin carboxylase